MRVVVFLIVTVCFVVAAVLWVARDNDASLMTDMIDWPATSKPPESGQADAPRQERSIVPLNDAISESESRSDGSETGLIDGGDELDWLRIRDVDSLYEELAARFRAGDVHAAYQLSQLIRYCMAAPVFMERMQEEPDFMQRMDELHVIFESMAEPCLNSRLSDRELAGTEHGTWLWKAATAGHGEAMHLLVFDGMGSTYWAPEEFSVESEEDSIALRREYADKLRQLCHQPSLGTIGEHLSQGSPITERLPRLTQGEAEGEPVRPLEGFAYRYAGARLSGNSRPAHTARHPDYPLTAAEESDAMVMAEALLATCP